MFVFLLVEKLEIINVTNKCHANLSGDNYNWRILQISS